MKGCTYRLSLEDIMAMRPGLLSLRGADGDNEPGEPDEGSSEDKGDKGDKSKESGDSDKDDKDGKKAEPDAKDRRIAGLEEEKDRHAKKRLEAETALAEANKRIKTLEKDGTPDDAVKRQNDELTNANASLVTINQSLALENAILRNTSHEWVDPAAVLRLLDTEGIEFDEKTGKAIGLDSALAKLAKASPYLLKVKEESKDDDSKPPRKSGTPPKPGTQKDADEKARQAKLRAKYPALRR